jgi:FkbM family methyltransferase
MKSIIKKYLNAIGLFTLRQANEKKYYFNFLEGVLISLLCKNNNTLKIVQIGANDGVHGDPLHQFVRMFNNQIKLLAIEPQVKAFNQLKDNYKDLKNIFFFNGCIGDGTIKPFYSLNEKFKKISKKKDIKIDGVSSFEKQNLIKRLEFYKVANFDTYIDVCKLESQLLETVLNKFNFDPADIGFLQIDAEGYDDQIIYNLKLNVFKFPLINYEFKNLSKNKILTLHKFLKKNNYRIIKWSRSDELAIKVH